MKNLATPLQPRSRSRYAPFLIGTVAAALLILNSGVLLLNSLSLLMTLGYLSRDPSHHARQALVVLWLVGSCALPVRLLRRARVWSPLRVVLIMAASLAWLVLFRILPVICPVG